jgi:hypothetical protein
MIEHAIEAASRVAPGGRAYFDALDERLRQPGYFDALHAAVRGHHGYIAPIVVTGQFGADYAEWRHQQHYPRPIVLPGGLRHGGTLDALPSARLYSGSEVILLDDSIYSGRTRQQIIDWCERWGAKVVCTHVLYDGSPERLPGVYSLYRYHP